MVGEDQHVVDERRGPLLAEPLQRRHGARLVLGEVGGPAVELAVPAALELAQQLDLVAARSHQDRAVLGGRDVPLQALEDELPRVAGAGRHDLGVLGGGALGGVAVVAVLGERHPVEAVRGALPGELVEVVLGVVAVPRVHVVISHEPGELGVAAAGARGGRGRGERQDAAREREAGGHADSAEERAAGGALRVEGRLGDRRVGPGRKVGGQDGVGHGGTLREGDGRKAPAGGRPCDLSPIGVAAR